MYNNSAYDTVMTHQKDVNSVIIIFRLPNNNNYHASALKSSLTVKLGLDDAFCIFCISLYSFSSRRARIVLSIGGGIFMATVPWRLGAGAGDTPLKVNKSITR